MKIVIANSALNKPCWLSTISYPMPTRGIIKIVNYTRKFVILKIVISGFHCIGSFHHEMWNKKVGCFPSSSLLYY